MSAAATVPRRARKALDQYILTDLSCAYDGGLIARIIHYCEAHNRRAYASKHPVSTTKGL